MTGARHFQFFLCSAREDGNTEYLTRRAAEALPKDVGQGWFDLLKTPLPAYRDHRHMADYTFAMPNGREGEMLKATLDATDIVIASPLYWYSVSAAAKLYLDYWADWLRVPGIDFKATMGKKTLWGVCAASDPDRAVAEPLVGTLRLSARFLGMGWGGVLFGDGSKPGDVMKDVNALAEAKTFFARTPEKA